ncbi:hypothetical protein BDK51DRAFT_28282, partial [Blyttiomyces helicus]
MGKRDKKDGRVGGNLLPAASSRAADLLPSSAFAFGPPAAFATTSFGTNAVELDLHDLDAELKVQQKLWVKLRGVSRPNVVDHPLISLQNAQFILKKLSKRDSITRMKALDDLSNYIGSAESETIQKMVPAWVGPLVTGLLLVLLHRSVPLTFVPFLPQPNFYNRLAIDADRRVRESTGVTHLKLVHTVRKQLAPHLKEIIGTWVCCQFDSSPGVQKAAVEAFQTEILAFIAENILNQTPETL